MAFFGSDVNHREVPFLAGSKSTHFFAVKIVLSSSHKYFFFQCLWIISLFAAVLFPVSLQVWLTENNHASLYSHSEFQFSEVQAVYLCLYGSNAEFFR